MKKTTSETVIIVWGPAGSGKSSVAESLASYLNYTYIEGDNYHAREAIDKMSAGIPLTDQDRWDWLLRLRKTAIQSLENGARGVVMSCSALRKKYRDELRVLHQERPQTDIRFVYLQVDPAILMDRITSRTSHYMKNNMLQGQLDILEPPTEAETDNSIADGNAGFDEVSDRVRSAITSSIGQ